MCADAKFPSSVIIPRQGAYCLIILPGSLAGIFVDWDFRVSTLLHYFTVRHSVHRPSTMSRSSQTR
jgi:hypothetical protein